MMRSVVRVTTKQRKVDRSKCWEAVTPLGSRRHLYLIRKYMVLV
jgi:hypothetical protein